MRRCAVATLLAFLALAPAARADGEFIVSGGVYYRIIGGAALRVGSCAPLNGCPGAVAGDPGAYRAAPLDGTFLRVAQTGAISRIAGGVPFRVADCAPVDGCAGVLDLDADGVAAYAAAHRDLPDGAYVRKADGAFAGRIARAAGGALLGIHSCAALSNCPGWVNVQSAGWDAYVAAHPLIADGVLVHVADGPLQSSVARAAGGALVHLTTCDPFNACAGLVSVDDGAYRDYAAAHPSIADGTFVRVADGVAAGSFMRAAGGRLIALSDCGALGGCPGAVGLDQGAVNEYQGVHPFPADGTVVQGVPSGEVWTFRAGVLYPGGDPGRAIALNDGSLAQFPRVRPPASGGSAPSSEPPRLLDSLVGGFFTTRRSRTWFTSLYVRDLPAGSVVTLTCRGRGCPLKRRTVTVARATKLLSLLRYLHGKRLRRGVRVEVTVTHAGMIGRVVRWTMRPPRRPLRTTLCLPPGAAKPTRC